MNHRYADCQNADPRDGGDCACMGTRSDLLRELVAAEAKVAAMQAVVSAARKRRQCQHPYSTAPGVPPNVECGKCPACLLADALNALDEVGGSPAERIDHIPSHKSPPDDGVTYMQIDRVPYRVTVGDYTGAQIRSFAHPPLDTERLDLWLLVPGENDRLILDDDSVAIRNSGLRMFTTPRFINAG